MNIKNRILIKMKKMKKELVMAKMMMKKKKVNQQITMN